MPQFGSTDRVGLNVVAETTWGVTPTTPAFSAVRFTGESLNFTTSFVSSEEIRADRMQTDTQKVSQQGAGDINGEMTYGTYDTFLSAAFMANWVTSGTPKTATDIALVKTAGTPNTWALTGTTMSGVGAVGQWVRVVRGALTFYARLTSVAAGTLGIQPLTDEPSWASGTSVVITPLNYLRNGTTKKSLSIQKVYNDLAAVTYHNFVGAKVGTWNLELTTAALIKTSFGVMAKDATMSETQIADATVAAANTNPSMNAADNVLGVVFDGDAGGSAYYFNTLKLTLDNALRAQMAVGTVGLIGIEAGKLKTTGTIEIYFESKALYDRFRAATALSLDFLMQDANGNIYAVTLPKVKFTKMEIVAGAQNQDIFAKCDFEALMNAESTYQIQLSRLAAA